MWKNDELQVLVDFDAVENGDPRNGILLKDGGPDAVVEAGFDVTLKRFSIRSYGEGTVLLEGSCAWKDGVFTVTADRTGKKFIFTETAEDQVAGISVTRRSTDVSTAYDTIFESLQLHRRQLLDPGFFNDPTTRVLPSVVPLKRSGTVTFYQDQYKLGLPLGEDIQTVLSIQYDREDYEKTIQRLSRITAAKPILYDDARFSLPAYVTALNWEGCSEYVLVDEPALSVHYVYLQNNTTPLTIPERFLPPATDTEPFTICE